jgi:anti-anti-sigma factor
VANLEISESIDPIPMITIAGEIDHFNCGQAESVVKRLLEVDSNKLVINLTELEYLDTAGVAMIFWTAKRLFDRGGQLRIVIPPGNVRRILEMAGIGNLPATVVYETLEDSLSPED